MATPVKDYVIPYGFQAIGNIDSVAAGITNPPPGIAKAIIQATGHAVSMRDDGTDPTSSVGFFLDQSGGSYPPFVYIGDLSKLKFIGTSAGAGVGVLIYV